ncbi:MAG: hypothetical protein J6S28_11180, partial [Clostridia bacterium]|nr:hypothetical protein [Clostridia bacterium]
YYGAGWEHIRAYIDVTTEAASHNHVGIYDSIENMLMHHMDRDQQTPFAEEMLALWEKALEEAQAEVHKAHVEKSMVQAYYMAQLKSKNCKEYLNRIYDICEKYGITHYREGVRIDFSQKGKPGSLG